MDVDDRLRYLEERVNYLLVEVAQLRSQKGMVDPSQPLTSFAIPEGEMLNPTMVASVRDGVRVFRNKDIAPIPKGWIQGTWLGLNCGRMKSGRSGQAWWNISGQSLSVYIGVRIGGPFRGARPLRSASDPEPDFSGATSIGGSFYRESRQNTNAAKSILSAFSAPHNYFSENIRIAWEVAQVKGGGADPYMDASVYSLCGGGMHELYRNPEWNKGSFRGKPDSYIGQVISKVVMNWCVLNYQSVSTEVFHWEMYKSVKDCFWDWNGYRKYVNDCKAAGVTMDETVYGLINLDNGAKYCPAEVDSYFRVGG